MGITAEDRSKFTALLHMSEKFSGWKAEAKKKSIKKVPVIVALSVNQLNHFNKHDDLYANMCINIEVNIGESTTCI